MFNVETDRILLKRDISRCNGIVYDGCSFFFNVKFEKKVIKYDIATKQYQRYETSARYAYLCYDSLDNCFWAIDDYDTSKIYMLNELFEPIDILHLSIPEIEGAQSVGITYDRSCDKLFIIYSNATVIWEKGSLKKDIVHYRHQKRIVGISQRYIYYYISGARNEIHIYTDKGKFFGSVRLPHNLSWQSIEIDTYLEDEKKIQIYVLAVNKSGKQFIICYSIEEKERCECNDWCSDALESIASEGEKLALILTTEGDKFIERVNDSQNIDERKAAYQSISKTICNVSDKEFKLVNKLQKIKECCNFCDEC